MTSAERTSGHRLMLRHGRRVGCGMLLALFLCGTAAPAAADVIERRKDGTIHVRAKDPGSRAGLSGTMIEAEGVSIPGDALTLVGDVPVPANFTAAVHHLAALNHLSPALLEAVVWQESRWRPQARSPAGAIGLAQLMPGTARDLGVDPRDPYANLAGGARYLRQQLDRFDGDVERALAAYNAGPGRVIRAGGIPPIRETQSYVRAVVSRMTRTQAR